MAGLAQKCAAQGNCQEFWADCKHIIALQGLECEETSLSTSQYGQESISPRSWDAHKEDTRCRSASTSDSQHSEGDPPFSSWMGATCLASMSGASDAQLTNG